MPTYKLKTEGETQILCKSNFEHEFTVDSVKQHLDYLKKKKTELTAQKSLEEAKMENIKSFHPEVLELTTEKRNAVALYDKAETMAKVCEEGLKAVEVQYSEYEQELKDIKEQTGIEIVPQETEFKEEPSV